jgi:glycosyltransferase involved in cell wall biosynthesis
MVQRDLRRAGPLIGCIQFGSAEFWLPKRLLYPYVTYDDQTVIQAKESYEYEWITSLRPREFDRLVKWQRDAYLSARACCAENEWAASSIVEDYGIPTDRVHVVGAGVGQVVAPEKRDWDSPRFLFVGKDWERKNGAKVIAAFNRVRERYESATLDVVGDHPPLRLPGVVGHGLIPPGAPGGFSKLSDLYQRATCLVVPSKHEPAAIAYLEAAAAGVGSIATSAGGSRTFVGDGGILVDPERDDELLAAMMKFADLAVAQEFGRRAQARARLFTWPLVAGRLVRAMTGSGEGPDFL